jgi:Tat protein translocase TatB subunit
VGLLSIPHLVIIFIVALIVFGPEKLPELARKLGSAMADLRRVSAELRGTFDEHLHELEREARELEQRRAETARQAAAQPAPAPALPEAPAAHESTSTAENPADGDAKPA